MRILQKIFTNKSVKILEIGIHEGRSAVWMLENLCKLDRSTFTSIDPYCTEDTTAPAVDETCICFCHNIKLCTEYDKFNQHKDFSKNVLPILIKENKVYDIIYIDGSHLMDDVLLDMEYSHHLLQSGGVMLVDNAGFNPKRNDDVMGAIKKFLNTHNHEYDILLTEWQRMLQRK